MEVGKLNQVFTLQNGITGTCLVEVTNYSLAGLTQYPPLSPPNPEGARFCSRSQTAQNRFSQQQSFECPHR